MGLPVGYLREVLGRYRINVDPSSDKNETNPATHTIAFNGNLQNAAMGLVDRQSLGDDYGTVFHESWHAWRDMHSPELAQLITAARRYYHSGTALGEDGRRVGVVDTERVVDEAAAEYIDHRVNAYVTTYGDLQSSLRNGRLTATQIDRVRVAYDAAARRLTNFGYQFGGGGPTAPTLDRRRMGSEQPIYGPLKAFVDSRILENRIPPTFDQGETFAALVARSPHRTELGPPLPGTRPVPPGASALLDDWAGWTVAAMMHATSDRVPNVLAASASRFPGNLWIRQGRYEPHFELRRYAAETLSRRGVPADIGYGIVGYCINRLLT